MRCEREKNTATHTPLCVQSMQLMDWGKAKRKNIAIKSTHNCLDAKSNGWYRRALAVRLIHCRRITYQYNDIHQTLRKIHSQFEWISLSVFGSYSTISRETDSFYSKQECRVHLDWVVANIVIWEVYTMSRLAQVEEDTKTTHTQMKMKKKIIKTWNSSRSELHLKGIDFFSRMDVWFGGIRVDISSPHMYD